MNCPKCNSLIDGNNNFCPICGTPINNINNNYNQNVNQPIDNMNNQNNNINQPIKNIEEPSFNFGNSNTSKYEEEDYVRAYIGTNVDKILNCKFSWWSLLFGAYYFMYRKMWLLAFGYLAINTILMSINIWVYLIAWLIMTILLGFYFPKLYVNHAKKKVSKIKEENPSFSEDAIIGLCAKKGGTALWSVFVLIGLEIIIVIVVAIFFYLVIWDGIKDSIDDLNNLDFNVEYNDNNTNDNNTNYSPTPVSSLYYTIPSGFEASGSNKENYVYYSYYDYYKKEDCSLSITKNKQYYNETAASYLQSSVAVPEDRISYFLESKIINNEWWASLSYTMRDGTSEYDYAIIKNDNIYQVKFTIYEDSGICSSAKNTLVNSLAFKEV